MTESHQSTAEICLQSGLGEVTGLHLITDLEPVSELIVQRLGEIGLAFVEEVVDISDGSPYAHRAPTLIVTGPGSTEAIVGEENINYFFLSSFNS